MSSTDAQTNNAQTNNAMDPDTDTPEEEMKDSADSEDTKPSEEPKKSWAFWAIILSLSLTGLCSSIEGTIITSALPTIIDTLGGGNAFVWVPNAYFLASIATLPLFAQASNVFGRRWLILGAVALFVLGSGLCGGASSMTMLIAARTVYVLSLNLHELPRTCKKPLIVSSSQGLGGGGIALLINIIVTDIVPLRERGKYMGLTQMAAAVGAALGPFIGGVITSRSSWRWVFYINLPIGGSECPVIDY